MRGAKWLPFLEPSISAIGVTSANGRRIGDSEMSDQWFDLATVRSSCLKSGYIILLCGAMLADSAKAAPRDNLSVVRDLASRVGPIIGSALACSSIAPGRVQLIIDKFQAVIRVASPTDAERADVKRSLDRYIADRRSAVAALAASNANAELSLTDAIAPSAANAATALNQPLCQVTRVPLPVRKSASESSFRFLEATKYLATT
jgi:hypothetical protein